MIFVISSYSRSHVLIVYSDFRQLIGSNFSFVERNSMILNVLATYTYLLQMYKLCILPETYFWEKTRRLNVLTRDRTREVYLFQKFGINVSIN